MHRIDTGSVYVQNEQSRDAHTSEDSGSDSQNEDARVLWESDLRARSESPTTDVILRQITASSLSDPKCLDETLPVHRVHSGITGLCGKLMKMEKWLSRSVDLVLKVNVYSEYVSVNHFWFLVLIDTGARIPLVHSEKVCSRMTE